MVTFYHYKCPQCGETMTLRNVCEDNYICKCGVIMSGEELEDAKTKGESDENN